MCLFVYERRNPSHPQVLNGTERWLACMLYSIYAIHEGKNNRRCASTDALIKLMLSACIYREIITCQGVVFVGTGPHTWTLLAQTQPTLLQFNSSMCPANVSGSLFECPSLDAIPEPTSVHRMKPSDIKVSSCKCVF